MTIIICCSIKICSTWLQNVLQLLIPNAGPTQLSITFMCGESLGMRLASSYKTHFMCAW